MRSSQIVLYVSCLIGLTLEGLTGISARTLPVSPDPTPHQRRKLAAVEMYIRQEA